MSNTTLINLALFNLPEDIIKYMGLKLDYKDLMRLSGCSNLLYNIICKDKMFWINKILAKRPDLISKTDRMMSLEIPNLIRKYMGIEGGTLYYVDKCTHTWKTSNVMGKIVKVSCGYDHMAMINEKGELWTFGNNLNGELGLGDYEARIIPTKVSLTDEYNKNIKAIKVSCGNAYTLIITEKGELFAYGRNYFGQLGLGDNNDRITPTKVSFNGNIGRIKKVSCNDYHTAIITEKGELWTFGKNEHGQLGLGDYFGRNIPNKLEKVLIGDEIDKIGRVYKVSCGSLHTAILTEKGELLTFGNNENGQLGRGNTSYRNIPTKLTKVVSIGGVGIIGRVSRVSCGNYHTAMVTEEGDLYTCGANHDKQLGLGDSENTHSICTPKKVTFISEYMSTGKISISCGGFHTAVITEKDELWTFGSNKYGQLGIDGMYIPRNNPSKITKTKISKISCGTVQTVYISLD